MGVSSFTSAPLVGAFFLLVADAVASCQRGLGRNAPRSGVERGHLRPTRKRRRTFRRQRISAALDTEEPAVDIAQQNLRRIRDGASDLGGAPRTVRERSGAGERLLPISGHDRRLAAAPGGGIAEPPPMFLEQARATPPVAARTPRSRLDQHLHAAACRYAEKPEAQQPAKLAHARIALAAATGAAHGQPDLITGGGPIDALQYEVKVEAELQL